MPNNAVLLRSKYIKLFLMLYVTGSSFWWGLNKRFNFLWRRSNHWGGWWEKRVACLMGSVLFSSNLIALNFVKRVSCKTTSALNIHAWHHCFNSSFFGQGKSSFKMKQLPFMAVLCTVMLFIVYRTTKYQYHQEEVRDQLNSLGYHCMYVITKGQNVYYKSGYLILSILASY